MRKWSVPQRWHITTLLAVLVAASLGSGTQPANKNAEVEDRLRADLKFLAGDDCEGRGIYTQGLEKAANHIADQFKKAELKAGGVDGTYFQPFTVSGPGKVEPGSQMILKGPQGQTIELRDKQDFLVVGPSGPGKASSSVVFVGYGISAPEQKYDDYGLVDVAGKVVFMLRRTPRWDHKQVPFGGDDKNKYADLKNKFATAEIHKAAAVVLVNDASEKGDKLDPLVDLGKGFSTSSIPTFHVKRQVLDQMLLSSLGQSVADIEKAIDRDLKPHSVALSGWTVTAEAKVTKKNANVKNVIAVVPGSGPLAKEFVVIGAHYDHLGRGEAGSKAKAEDNNKIHHGADDNASGTTAVLELARRFGGMKKWQGRTLVFMTFSAEEKGLIGSSVYCKNPLFPLADTVAMVNLDMVGRMAKDKKTGKGRLIVEGTGTAKHFDELIEKFNKKYDFTLDKKKGGGPYSDHYSFYLKKIPVVFMWTDVHVDYHKPSDTWDKINYTDMSKIVDLAEEVITHLGSEEKRPEYVYIPPEKTTSVMNIPKMGFMPGGYNEANGVPVGAVTPGGPADKAGIKEGDRIIAINELQVTTFGTYMLLMSKHKAGQVISITVQRGAEKLTFKVTPQ